MAADNELLIVGGGPAGLSAALVAARARRRVVLVDSGTPRNAAAPAVHGFLTRDGVLPADLRAAARDQLAQYPTVQVLDGEVRDITGERGAFLGVLDDGQTVPASRVLLAMGLVDVLPDVPGVRERWGRGVHHCPYCDGYEHRDRAWGVWADEPTVFDYALFLRGWTPRVTVFTNGGAPRGEAAAKLLRAGIAVETTPIARVIGHDDHRLEAIELTNGRRVPIESLWLRPAQRQRALTARLGLAVDDDGAIVRDEHGETPTPGVFAAGDLGAGATQQALQAAADGARVAMTVNHQLIVDDETRAPALPRRAAP